MNTLAYILSGFLKALVSIAIFLPRVDLYIFVDDHVEKCPFLSSFFMDLQRMAFSQVDFYLPTA